MRVRGVNATDEIERCLSEDAPFGDLTTDALGIAEQSAAMTFAARDPMVVALVEDAVAMIERTGAGVDCHARSGDRLASGVGRCGRLACGGRACGGRAVVVGAVVVP